MVTIDESKVVEQVRINLDEIGKNDADFASDLDESELETIIRQKMGEAYRYVLQNAKGELMDADLVTVVNAVQVGGSRIAKAEADVVGLLRFVWANADGWCHPVFEPIFWNTSEYAMLCDPHTTGTAERPKVGVCPVMTGATAKPVGTVAGETAAEPAGTVAEPTADAAGTGARAMMVTLYGTENGGLVGVIKEPTGEEGEQLRLTGTLYAAYLYYITALVLLTLRESEHAEEMMGQALALMGMDVSNKAQ